MEQAGQVLAFRAGGGRYGVPAAQVRAIAGMSVVTPVPHAPDCLIGLGNVRGEATPVIALSRLLGRPDGVPRRLLLIESSGRFALAVDHVEGMVGPDDAPEQPPLAALLAEAFPDRNTLSARGRAADRFSGAKQDEDRLALLVFSIDSQRFAFPLDQIEHVAAMPDTIASFPRGDAVALGTISHADAAVPLLSLAALLALPKSDALQGPVLIVRIGQHRVGLRVDAVERVVRAPVSRIDPVPVVLLRGEAEAVIAAIYRPAEGGRLVSILAADQLLSADMTARLGPAGQQAPSGGARVVAQTEPLLLVAVAGHRLGFPLATINGVERLPRTLARLPGAPPFLTGLGHLRGEVCPIVDLAVQLGEVGRPAGGGAVLVCNLGGAPAGLRADAVIGIVHAPVAQLREAGSLGDERTRPFERTLALEDGQHFALILSVDALFAQMETDLLRTVQKVSAEPA